MKRSSSQSEANKLRNFIIDVGFPLNRLPSAMGISACDFMSWWVDPSSRKLSSKNMESVASYLSIDENEILNGNYNRSLVRARLFKNMGHLPDKYMLDQYSFIRTSAHIIKYIVMTRGQHFCDKVLRKLNVSPLIFDNLDNKINLSFFVDLLETLEACGFSRDEMDTLACVLFLGIGDTSLGDSFRKAENYFECYKVLSENLSLFDENFNYNSELDTKQFILYTDLYYDKFSDPSWQSNKLGRLFRYRKFLLAWFPYLSNLPPIIPICNIEYKPDKVSMVLRIQFPSQFKMPFLT